MNINNDIFQNLVSLIENYNISEKDILIDRKMEIIVPFCKILLLSNYQNFDIDKSQTTNSKALESKPNKIRRAIKKGITVTDSIIAFEKFDNEFDEIEILNKFGITKEELEKIRHDIIDFKNSVNIKEIDFKSLSILEHNPIQFKDQNVESKNIELKELILSKKNQDLKSKIINLATKNVNEYKAQILSLLEESNLQYIQSDISNNNINNMVLQITQISIDLVKELKQTNFSLEDKLANLRNDNLVTNIELVNNLQYILLILGEAYFEKDLDSVFLFYHHLLTEKKERTTEIIKTNTNKVLYQGYLKWCKRNKESPLIKLSFNTRKTPINKLSQNDDSLIGKLHFERKLIFNNVGKFSTRDIVVPFYKRLLQLLINQEILDSKTTDSNFLFVLGYGSETKDDFERIKIVKPKEKQSQYTGKSTIIHLLTLLGYNLEEIRGNGNIKERTREKDLILKNCFLPNFKAQDFQHPTKPNRIISEIVKKAYLQAPTEVQNPNFIEQLNEYIRGKG